MSYLKTRNSIYNKLLTSTYLQTHLFTNALQFTIKKAALFNRIHKIVIQMYRCTTHTEKKKKKRKENRKSIVKLKVQETN